MDKERKIAFYTLVKDMWANNADGLEGLIPFYEIKEVLSSTYKCNFLGADNKQ